MTKPGGTSRRTLATDATQWAWNWSPPATSPARRRLARQELAARRAVARRRRDLDVRGALADDDLGAA